MKQVIKGAAKFFLMFLLLMFIATYIFPENEQGKVEVPFYYAMGSLLFSIFFPFLSGKKQKKERKEELKGVENPYDYYPEDYVQDKNKSLLTDDGKYDMIRFSVHEDWTIRNVIAQANKKYSIKYRGIGLANESYPVVYKPRYILFDVIVIVFGDSKNPFDQIAVSFAYIQKGAYYRKNAIEYFETAIDQVPLSELNRFASVSELSMFTKIAEVYEKEHEYEKAIYWLKVLIKRRIGNTLYFHEKIKKIESYIEKKRPIRKRTMQKEQEEFERQTYEAALHYAILVEK